MKAIIYKGQKYVLAEVKDDWVDMSSDDQKNFQATWEAYDGDDELNELVIDLIEDLDGKSWTVGVQTNICGCEFTGQKGSEAKLKEKCEKLGNALLKVKEITKPIIKWQWNTL